VPGSERLEPLGYQVAGFFLGSRQVRPVRRRVGQQIVAPPGVLDGPPLRHQSAQEQPGLRGYRQDGEFAGGDGAGTEVAVKELHRRVPGSAWPCAQQVRHADGDIEDHRCPDHVAEVDDALHVPGGALVNEEVVRAEIGVHDLPGQRRQRGPYLLVELIEDPPRQRGVGTVLDVVKQRAHPMELLEIPDQEPVLPRMGEVAQGDREPREHRADRTHLAR
jgi:hypothetical protein